MGGLQLAHHCGLAGAFRRSYCVADPRLQQTWWGLQFRNPVGLAAGFDKDARWFSELGNLGFGAIEIGSITGQGQPGNPRPRLFRLKSDRALINRMGFNNQGAEVAARNLAARDLSSFRQRVVLGINLGKTKIVPNEAAPDDYAFSFRKLFEFGDYFVINVSSPNTPGLRALQDKEPLQVLLAKLAAENQRLAQVTGGGEKPLLLKIAPDLSDPQLDDVAELVAQPGIAGVIATNTTLSRQGLRTPASRVEAIGAGGLSGVPLQARSLEVVGRLYRQLPRTKPIIGVGGISDGESAWQMLRHGASLLQLYTGFVYEGPGVVARINRELGQRMTSAGVGHISEVVGQHWA
jgi:dihydroorotate dehydrogenase